MINSLTGRENSFSLEIDFPEKSKYKSRHFTVTTVLAVLFFVTTIIFVGLFAYYFTRHHETEPVSIKESTTTTTKAAAATTTTATATVCGTPDCLNTTTTENNHTTAIPVCGTLNCLDTANKMISYMNMSVDPCTNFHEFACGGFIERATLDGYTSIGATIILNAKNILLKKEIVLEEIQPGEPMYLTNMKRLYKSCMDEARIEELGVTPYLNDTAFSRDWPTINKDWTGDNFSLPDITARYEKAFAQPLFQLSLYADIWNSSQRAIYIYAPDLALSPEQFSKPRNNTLIMALQKFVADVAYELGATREDADKDAKDVVDLQIALSTIMPSETNMQLIVLQELSTLYPELDIARALRGLFETVNITLSDDEKVIIMHPTYMENIPKVLSQFSNRTIQNLFGFNYAESKIEHMTRRLRTIAFNFNKLFTGRTKQATRLNDCLDIVLDLFPLGVAKQFVNRVFFEADKLYIEEMVDNLKAAFRGMIDDNTWMGEATKAEAYKKLDKMGRKIGYPDTGFEEEDIEAFYADCTMSEDSYYSNVQLIEHIILVNDLPLLRTPIDKTVWVESPANTNAYNYANNNEILFPAAILRPPYFSPIVPDYINFGAVGSIIGHELTHGFDNIGAHFDEDGNLRNWWQESDMEKFINRTQCIIDQYSGFFVQELQMNLKGNQVQGECIADIGGVTESFRAYKDHVRRKGEQPTLPGLGLTQDQLFFLSFSQLYCEILNVELLTYLVTEDVHPPGNFRIIGTLQNSEDFARAYNCPRGSFMNPETKCGVW